MTIDAQPRTNDHRCLRDSAAKNVNCDMVSAPQHGGGKATLSPSQCWSISDGSPKSKILWRTNMVVHLHFICKQGLNHKKIANQVYETGNWQISEKIADESIGGRIYLHEKQDQPAWHGGTIISWRISDRAYARQRLVFTYSVDSPFRIKCDEGWGQEKAILRR
jgi:hypothetical protein